MAGDKMYNLYSYRRKRPTGMIVTIVLAVGIFVTSGYFVYKKLKEPIEFKKETITEESYEKEISATATKNDTKYDKNCDFYLNTLYLCGHNETSQSKIPDNFHNKTIDEIKNDNPRYDIYNYNDFSIYANEFIGEICNNHFIIKLNGNNLISYNKKTPDVIEKEKKLNLKEFLKDDIEILRNGIEFSSKTELLEFFENFAS